MARELAFRPALFGSGCAAMCSSSPIKIGRTIPALSPLCNSARPPELTVDLGILAGRDGPRRPATTDNDHDGGCRTNRCRTRRRSCYTQVSSHILFRHSSTGIGLPVYSG